MLFNSVGFALFLPIVFVLYWFVTRQNLLYQNILLLISSYFFYACWDWRFLFLLVFSTFLDYSTAIKMYDSKNKMWKKFWFWLSICVNVGFLGFFKYYNFFVQSFAEGLSDIGLKANFWTLKIILPVGISFYTFHGLSYVIDIYNNRIRPEKNFIDYSVFVSFFPLLVAGPIERATHLLPQIQQKRAFDYSKAADGLRQILWGLFKKMVIADNCAKFANNIFNYSDNFSGATLFLGAFFFAVQIYCDFSGYSDIAIGTARLFGLDLLRNFAFPYFSRDIAEFWRRWHISLSTWFRDYLYISMGGKRVSKPRWLFNLFITFLISGLWHGANWTYVLWGSINGGYLVAPQVFNATSDKILPGKKTFYTLKTIVNVIITFLLICFAWIFFRANSISDAFMVINRMIHNSGPLFIGNIRDLLYGVSFLILIVIVEMIQEYRLFNNLSLFHHPNYLVRYSTYISLCLLILLFGVFGGGQFIYFQF